MNVRNATNYSPENPNAPTRIHVIYTECDIEADSFDDLDVDSDDGGTDAEGIDEFEQFSARRDGCDDRSSSGSVSDPVSVVVSVVSELSSSLP